MKSTASRKITYLVLIVLLNAGLLGFPAEVSAASCSADPSINIQPTAFLNTTAVEIAITRPSVFDVNTTVILGSIGVLNTTVNGNILTAIVPAGTLVGTYPLTILEPGQAAVNCANAITISAPTNIPAATHTPAPTDTPAPTNFIRPVIAVDSYGASSLTINAGQNLDFDVTLVNWGQITAANIVLNFGTGDFAPRVTGGQRVVNSLDPNQRVKVYQPLTASNNLYGKNVALLELKVDYTDASGNPFSETFTLTFPIAQASAGPTKTQTATATLAPRPQLLVTSYQTKPDSLQPGQKFTLSFEVTNTGAGNAKRVSLILGGGTASGGSSGGTPGAGGISGAGGDFTNFAPLESANVQFLGDIASRASINLQQSFIVNAGAEAGAYPMKITFAYSDEIGNSFNDDQAITLLVYAPPLVEISFYRPPDPFFIGQPGQLPLQIVNKSRSSVLLGNLTVTSEKAELSNNTILIGNLDTGGSFPLDAVAVPSQPGALEFTVTVDYIDDFNQPQIITEVLSVEVLDIPTPDPNVGGGPGGEFSPSEPETLTDMILRFLAGFLGLDSAPPESTSVPIPVESEIQVEPAGPVTK